MNDATRQYVIDQIHKGFTMLDLPDYMKDGVMLWVVEGIPPGSFLTSVLENNLKGAVFGADSNNVKKIREWAQFCTWYLPASCQGSRESVAAWRGLDPEDDTDRDPELSEDDWRIER